MEEHSDYPNLLIDGLHFNCYGYSLFAALILREMGEMKLISFEHTERTRHLNRSGMTTVYFVRHAEADNSVRDGRIRPLIKKGMSDRALVTTFLNDKNIDV